MRGIERSVSCVLVVGVLIILAGPSMAAPSGYKCGRNGKPIAGVGCQCGKGEVAEIDAKNKAICTPAPKPKATRAESVAAAPRPKYTRAQSLKVDVKLDDRTRPIVGADSLAGSFPTLSYDDVFPAESSDSEQVDVLVALSDGMPDRDPGKADLTFRIAEAYARQHAQFHKQRLELEVKARKTTNVSERATLSKESEAANAKAQLAVKKAVPHFKKLTSAPELAGFARMDVALFEYSRMAQRGRYMKEARQAYNQLVKTYPTSDLVLDARTMFADYYFELAYTESTDVDAHLEDAAAIYERASESKGRIYPYVLYRLAWAQLKRGDHVQALKTFEKLVALPGGKPGLDILRRVAVNDIALAYSYAGKADLAAPYFRRIDRTQADAMMQRLGDAYLEQGKPGAITIFRELVSLYPSGKSACLWQYNIAHAMITQGTNAEKVTEIERLAKLYAALTARKSMPAAEAKQCRANAIAMTGDMARAYHNESAKTLNPETMVYASRLYAVYLEVFPDAANTTENQYYAAELLWSRAENERTAKAQALWEETAVAFTAVIKTGKADQKLIKESAYASVLAWKNALALDPRVKAPAAPDAPADGSIPAPRPVPEREQKMLDAFDVYINHIRDPNDEELVGMKFLKANTYRRYFHYDEANVIFEDILENHPKHEVAEYSANILLDNLNRLKDYEKMRKWVDVLLADPTFLDGRDELAEHLRLLKSQLAGK